MGHTERNDHRRIRIVVGDTKGKWAEYRDIATLVIEVNGKIEVYVAVTEYGLSGGVLEPEEVYRAIPT